MMILKLKQEIIIYLYNYIVFFDNYSSRVREADIRNNEYEQRLQLIENLFGIFWNNKCQR